MPANIEQKILWEIIKVHYGTGNSAKLKNLLGKSDWQILAQIIRETEMDGFVYWICDSQGIKEWFPNDFMSNLQKKAGYCSLRNSFIQQSGIKVINLLNDNGIDYILVKGLVILKSLYDDDMMRAIGDLDIVIRQEHSSMLDKIREEIGHIEQEPPFPIIIELHVGQCGLCDTTELQWLYPINQIDWFANRSSITLDGCPTTCLNNEAALIHMIYHLSIHHSFMGLKWLVDICQMVVKYQAEIDWEKIFGMSADQNLRRLVSLCLTLVSDITGISQFGRFRPVDFSGSLHTALCKRMMFLKPHSMQAKLQGRLFKIVLPVSSRDKLRMSHYYLFDRQSIVHRTGTKKRNGFDPFQPLRLVNVVIKDLFAVKK